MKSIFSCLDKIVKDFFGIANEAVYEYSYPSLTPIDGKFYVYDAFGTHTFDDFVSMDEYINDMMTLHAELTPAELANFRKEVTSGFKHWRESNRGQHYWTWDRQGLYYHHEQPDAKVKLEWPKMLKLFYTPEQTVTDIHKAHGTLVPNDYYSAAPDCYIASVTRILDECNFAAINATLVNILNKFPEPDNT